MQRRMGRREAWWWGESAGAGKTGGIWEPAGEVGLAPGRGGGGARLKGGSITLWHECGGCAATSSVKWGYHAIHKVAQGTTQAWLSRQARPNTSPPPQGSLALGSLPRGSGWVGPGSLFYSQPWPGFPQGSPLFTPRAPLRPCHHVSQPPPSPCHPLDSFPERSSGCPPQNPWPPSDMAVQNVLPPPLVKIPPL